MMRSFVQASALLLSASPLAAQADPCISQAVSRGNNVTGRTLAVAREYPGVPAADLFDRLHSAITAGSDKLGSVQVTNSDPARGVISGMVTPGGAARPAALELAVAVLPSGDTQVTLTNRLPRAMFVNSRQWAASTCAFLASVTATGSGREATVSARAAGTAAAGGGVPTVEARAAAAGISYREVVAGTLTRSEEIDGFRLRDAAAGDTIRTWHRDPREPQPTGLGRWHHPDLKVSVRDQGIGRTLTPAPGGDVILSGTGPFEVRVESERSTLPYLVQVTKTSNAPEHVPALITTRDTVRGEAIDYPRDTDEFSFAGRAGEEIQIYLGDHSSLAYSVLRRRPGGRDEELPRGSAGIIRLPTDGTYVLSVGVAFLTTQYDMTAPYWFRIRRRD